MRSVSLVLGLCLATSLFLTVVAGATQVLYLTIEQLGSKSAIVVRGEVVSTQSYWNDQRTKIFTETTVTVDQTYKGNTGATVQILQLGGTVGNVRVTAHGALQWTAGEEVVLFLEPYADGKFQVSGFSQGKFNVVRDPQTDQAFVMRPVLDEVQVIGAPDDGGETAGLVRMPLNRFIAQALGEPIEPEEE